MSDSLTADLRCIPVVAHGPGFGRRARVIVEESRIELTVPAESRRRHFRRGKKKATSLILPPEIKKRLRLLAAEHDMTIQNLLAEELNDLFAKNGRPEVAPFENQA